MSEVKVTVNGQKKRKVGRPKKDNKILAKKELTNKGFSVIINKETGHFELVTLKFHIPSGQAYVESQKFIGETRYRAEFELKKLIAHGDIYND